MLIVALLIPLFIFAAVYAVLIYNGLVSVTNNIKKAWANIDVLLKQRYDELRKLVDVCKGYITYEKEILEKLTCLRTSFANSSNVDEIAKIDSQTSKTLKSILAVAENYPDLKANTSFLFLQKRISELESHIADRRELYNDCVNIYNIRIHQLPDALIANFLNLQPLHMFKVDESDKSEVEVNISAADTHDNSKYIKDWLALHRDLLLSFDQNKDMHIDKHEIENAAAAARKYALLSRHPETKWMVYKNNAVTGPCSWGEVTEFTLDDKFTMVSLQEDKLWLPFAAVEIALKSV